MSSRLIQYILIMTDSVADWPLGAVVAQGCHAAIACAAKYKETVEFIEYTDSPDLCTMKKIVLGCSVKEWTEIRSKCESIGIEFFEWFEEPEKILTAVAFKPGLKGTLRPLVGHLGLLG